jgi:HK97 family phage portal protein
VSLIDRIFRKSRSDLPTSISANTADIESPAWSINVVNELTNDYDNMARPYCDNPVVRAAVEAMRRNATKAVLQVGRYDKDGGFEPVDHPLLKIWPNPCPGYTDGNLIEEAYTSLIGEEGDGNAYIQLIADKAGDAIVELMPIPPLWVRYPLMGETVGEVMSWPVMGADWGRIYSFDVPSSQMLHIKTGRSSGGPTLGKSCLKAVAADMALIKLASIYETTILTRAGVPSMIIKILGNAGMMLNNSQIAQIQADFSRATSGRGVSRPAVTKGDVDISTPGFSPEQLSVAEMTNMAVSRVCGVLGWAPMTLKQPDTGKTYSNLIEANKASWRDAILPFLEQIATALTKAVQTMPFRYGDELFRPDDTLAVRFDVSQIEELSADMNVMAERAVKLYTAGIITAKQACDIVSMDYEEKEDRPTEGGQDTESEGDDDGSQER